MGGTVSRFPDLARSRAELTSYPRECKGTDGDDMEADFGLSSRGPFSPSLIHQAMGVRSSLHLLSLWFPFLGNGSDITATVHNCFHQEVAANVRCMHGRVFPSLLAGLFRSGWRATKPRGSH